MRRRRTQTKKMSNNSELDNPSVGGKENKKGNKHRFHARPMERGKKIRVIAKGGG